VTQLGHLSRAWAESVNPWTNVYGLARSLLALGTCGTLLSSHSEVLFGPVRGRPSTPFCEDLANFGLFCLLPREQLELARWLAVAVLAVAASGWRPRLTGLLHWWVSISFQTSATILDGGDQVTAILTLLLLPVTLTDNRRWHWGPPVPGPPLLKDVPRRLVALSALTVIRVQIAGIYLHTSIAKFGVAEWADGTALYYWLTDPLFGAAGWLGPMLWPLLTNGIAVAVSTWGVLLLELLLAMALVMPKRAWKVFLVMGVAFHLAIALVMGLVSFAAAMWAGLILYLRPVEEPFLIRQGSKRVVLESPDGVAA
jgi:antimicrobial peptide system SdpB family protein